MKNCQKILWLSRVGNFKTKIFINQCYNNPPNGMSQSDEIYAGLSTFGVWSLVSGQW